MTGKQWQEAVKANDTVEEGVIQRRVGLAMEVRRTYTIPGGALVTSKRSLGRKGPWSPVGIAFVVAPHKDHFPSDLEYQSTAFLGLAQTAYVLALRRLITGWLCGDRERFPTQEDLEAEAQDL